MPANTFILPFRPAFDSNGLPVPGAQLNFYLAGTLTRTPVYAEAAMTNELPNPVVANSAGRFVEIFLNDAITYRVVLTDEDGVVLDDNDPYTYGAFGTYVDIVSPQTLTGPKTFTAPMTGATGTFDDLIVDDEAYGAGWNASLEVPTKNAVYDKIETLSSVITASGTYTPTISGVTNVISAAPNVFQYMRVGSVVTVSGRIEVDPSTTSAFELGISLPIASGFTPQETCSGTACAETGATVGCIFADGPNDRASLRAVPANVNIAAWHVHFTYRIV